MMTAGSAAPAIFGRDVEIEQLRGLVADTAGGTGNVVWIEGEPGIGKTALLRRLLDDAARHGCAVHRATADRLFQRFPLRVLLDCLGVGPRSGDPEVLAIHDRLRGALPAPVEDPVPVIAEQLIALIEQRCAAAPMVLAIDDIQWADETSLLVWHRLTRFTEQHPLLLVAAARPSRTRAELGVGRRDDREAVRLSLPALDPAATAQLAAHLAGGAEIGPKLRKLLEHTSGNPQYTEEVVRALADEKHLDLAAGVVELSPVATGLPRSVAESVAARLEFVSTESLSLLRMASLLGPTFSVSDLRTVSERPVVALVGCVEEALAAGLLVESGSRLNFQHELIRHALYETTPTALRLALHHQAARALEASGASADRVGEQLLAAVRIADAEVDEWVLDWLTRNARTLAHAGPDLAERLLQLVVPSAGDERRDQLRTARVLALVQLNRPTQVRELAEKALADGPDESCAAELNWYLTWSLATLGLAEEATEIAEKALHTPGFERPWLARMQAMLGRVLLTKDHFDAAYAAVDRAVSEARAAADDYALGLALHVRGSGLARQCDLSEGVICFEEAAGALGDAPEHTDLRLQVLGDRMMLLFALGRSDEADSALHELLAIAERSATPSRLAAIRLSAAYHYFTVGRWDDATAELEAATELTAHMSKPDRSRLHGLSAMIAGQRGEREAFRFHLDELGPATRGFPLVAEVMRAEIDGETERAVRLLTGFLQRGDRFATRYVFLPQLVRLAMEIDDTETAAAANDACAEDASVGAVPNILAASQHCRGLLDRDPTALRAAIELYRKSNQSPKCARALEDLALLLAERGETTAARKSYAEAVEIFQSLGASWDLRRIDSRLRAHGLQRTRKRKQRAATGWEALTKTERRVALLVGEGLANPEIAATLSSSRRTIEVHVSHVLSKLGVRSRVEIAVEATRHSQAEDAV